MAEPTQFREVQAGEERLEGVLERIECLRGGGSARIAVAIEYLPKAKSPDVSDGRLVRFDRRVRSAPVQHQPQHQSPGRGPASP
jgi:hypothetical protein